MIVCITMKHADAIYNARQTAVGEEPSPEDEDAHEKWYSLCDEFDTAVEKFIQWGEYLTISIDTEAGTAKVQEV